MNKHTPGPWQIGQKDNQIVAGETGLHIAEVATVGMGHAVSANARLIAAAPYLLEVLSNCVQHLEPGVTGEWLAAWARAVIAEATGDQDD